MTDEMPETSTLSPEDNELRYARDSGYFDQNIIIRFVIIGAFALSLFLVLHFREAAIEILELNSTAPRYVVAQVPFDFVDDEATLILRQEAVRDIGRIYKLSERQVNQRRADFETELQQENSLQSSLKQEDAEEVYAILDIVQNALKQMYLTDPRTIQKLHESESYTDNFQIFTPYDTSAEVIFPQQIWVHLTKIYLPREQFRSTIVSPVIDYFKNKSWRIEEDVAMQRKLRKKVQSEVPEKYTHMSAGSRIIDQGEKVTARHVAMLQAMKEEMNKLRNLWHPATLLGSLLLTLLLTIVSGAFLQVNFPQVLASNRKLCLLVAIIILTLTLSKAVEYFVLTSRGNLYELVRYPLLVPFAAILTCNLMSTGLATAVSGFLIIILTISLAFNTEAFLVINLVGAIVAILTTRSLRRRKDLFAVCAKVWLMCSLVIIARHLYAGTLTDLNVVNDLLSTAVFMVMTVLLILGILPLLETTFSVMSDVTLIEYMDPDNALLRRLSFEAPGTYQHTLVVCSLAEAAAKAIGANGLFCRASCLYHDIGKMMTPKYFTENQQSDVDMHKLLTPAESAQAIIAHVTEGVIMARKAGLPEQFIDVIKEHHGTTLVYFFYHKALEMVGGDTTQLDDSEFRYAGPKPRSKESAIIMIADSFEAASRSLDRIDEEELMRLIDRLVDTKAKDGQFDECLLTFEELSIVKKTLVSTLAAAYHSRVKYPERTAVD